MEPMPHEIEPLKVHVVEAPAWPHKSLRTDFGTETVDNTNPVRPLLPASSQRRSAHVQATGGDVWLCDSQAKASSATPEGAVLPSANTAPWPVHGQNAVWIVQKTANSTCVVSFTAEYEGE